MDINKDHEYLFDEDDESGDYKYFVLTGFHERNERLELERKIESLGARVLYDVTWNDHITHIVLTNHITIFLLGTDKSLCRCPRHLPVQSLSLQVGKFFYQS